MIALALLLVTQLGGIVTNESWQKPPKTDSDGPDYENLAFHLSVGDGFLFDNRDPRWLEVYLAEYQQNDEKVEAPARRLLMTGRPPLYPFLVAGVYCLLGRGAHSFAFIRCVSAAFIALACSLSVWVTANYFRESIPQVEGGEDGSAPSSSLAASVATCVGATTTALTLGGNRTLHSYALDFLTEPLAFLLMQTLVVAMIVATGSKREGTDDAQHTLESTSSNPDSAATLGRMAQSWPLVVASGMLLGLLILARSIFIVWVPGIFALCILVFNGSFKRRAALASIVTLVAILVCVPWWIRNIVVLERMMPLGTQGAITLIGGYSDEALARDGGWYPNAENRLRSRLSASAAFQSAVSDSEREIVVNTAASRELRDWIATHANDIPHLFANRVYTHWNPYTGVPLVWKLAALLGAAVLMLRARLSRVAWRHAAWLCGLLILSTFVAGILYTTGGRFLVPLYGVISSLAGISAGTFVKKIVEFCGNS